LRIGASMSLPIVATAAALTPEIAPKIVAVPTVVKPRLPRAPPMPACMTSPKRAATLPRPMSSPA